MKSDAVTPESYCRDVESYLCRKNEGHLIRLSGPAFERVVRWAEDGIPLKVVWAGIDRYFERYYRRGPRRRPVRIEFCEADVLDAFDDWRRAVGVADEQQQVAATPPKPRHSLAAHIERVIARLTMLRASSHAARTIEPVLESVARELDGMLTQARTARGTTRDALLATLANLDRALISAALDALELAVRERARQEAHVQLEPFRQRMAADAYQRAVEAAVEQHVREHLGLPTVSFT
jgi:hypothetical protein